jgi:hypothetical protein
MEAFWDVVIVIIQVRDVSMKDFWDAVIVI